MIYFGAHIGAVKYHLLCQLQLSPPLPLPFAAAAAVITADDIRYLLALFHEFGLEKREGIEGRWYGCARDGIQSVLFPSRRE
jgi:hypothetical protein